MGAPKIRITGPRRAILLGAHAEPDKAYMIWSGDWDRVAQGLSNLGYGYFINNRFRYSWRKRDGYGNRFELNDEGKALAAELAKKVGK